MHAKQGGEQAHVASVCERGQGAHKDRARVASVHGKGAWVRPGSAHSKGGQVGPGARTPRGAGGHCQHTDRWGQGACNGASSAERGCTARERWVLPVWCEVVGHWPVHWGQWLILFPPVPTLMYARERRERGWAVALLQEGGGEGRREGRGMQQKPLKGGRAPALLSPSPPFPSPPPRACTFTHPPSLMRCPLLQATSHLQAIMLAFAAPPALFPCPLLPLLPPSHKRATARPISLLSCAYISVGMGGKRTGC